MSQNTANEWPADAKLVAFADGQLDPGEAAKIALFLSENEDARLFVERLMASGNLAKVAYDEALATRADDKLTNLILGSRPSRDATAMGTVVPLPSRAKSKPAVAHYALPMAAAIALVIGSLAGYQLGRRGMAPANGSEFGVAVGPIGHASPVKALLEQRASGEFMPVSADAANADKRHLMVVASFRDRTGRICREFEVVIDRDDAVPVTAAIACRHGDGLWHVEGAAQVTAAPPIPEKDFSPAGSNETSAIAGILEAIGAKRALPKADEDALLKNGWK